MPVGPMPPIEIVWFLVLASAIFFVASSFFLRLSCTLANCVGHKTRQSPQLRVPGYGSCLAILLVAVFAMSLLEGVLAPIVTPIAKAYFDDVTVYVVASCLRALMFALLVTIGLRSDRQAPKSLATLAASFHVILLILSLVLARAAITFASAAGQSQAA